MRIKLVSHLKGDEVLAEALLTEENEVLIPTGKKLKPEYKELILSLGIDTVTIEDPYEKKEELHLLVDEIKKADYVAQVKKILESHIYSGKKSLKEMELVAKNMIEEVNNQTQEQVFDYFERSTDLYDHTVMVTLLSLFVAKKMKISKERQTEIAIGALLHDLGIRYITVPYLNCSLEERSAAELFEYKKHTILGYSALEEETWIPALSKKMILSHHERKDGSGFPLKQKNQEMECCILQVCDQLDCMVTGMECRRTTLWEAMEHLKENQGSWYEEKVVSILQDMLAKYPAGTEIELENKKHGVVVKQTMQADKPIILITDEPEQLFLNLEEEKEHSIRKIQ